MQLDFVRPRRQIAIEWACGRARPTRWSWLCAHTFTDLRGLLSFPQGPQSATNFHRFAPRFGFAYRLGASTVVRGGYGMSFVPQSIEQGTAIGVNYSTAPTQTSQTGQVVQPGGTRSPTYLPDRPVPGRDSRSARNHPRRATMIGKNPVVAESERQPAYVQLWNFTIQRLLPGRMVVDLAYVGSHGVRLPLARLNLNQISPTLVDYARLHYKDAKDVNGAAARLGLGLLHPTGAESFLWDYHRFWLHAFDQTVQRQYLLRPYPQYADPTLYRPLSDPASTTRVSSAAQGLRPRPLHDGELRVVQSPSTWEGPATTPTQAVPPCRMSTT